jgi:hypothetical protein
MESDGPIPYDALVRAGLKAGDRLRAEVGRPCEPTDAAWLSLPLYVTIVAGSASP